MVSLNLLSSEYTKTMFPGDFEIVYHISLLNSDEPLDPYPSGIYSASSLSSANVGGDRVTGGGKGALSPPVKPFSKFNFTFFWIL